VRCEQLCEPPTDPGGHQIPAYAGGIAFGFLAKEFAALIKLSRMGNEAQMVDEHRRFGRYVASSRVRFA
jgi:hypothetical protein